MYAAISADIVSSTSLPIDSMIGLNERLRECLNLLERRYEDFWGRIVRGDSIECLMAHPEDALEVAIILKTWVKSFVPEKSSDTLRFSRYGIRMAIGIGNMDIVDRHLDMMDGEAIYRSGRTLDKLIGHSKYSFAISMEDEYKQQTFQVLFALINQLLNNATSRRCKTLCVRILESNAKRTAASLGISVSGVNQNLGEIGWPAIEDALVYYRKNII